VKLPVLDKDGLSIHTGGITAYAGLYFVGLPWLPMAKSGLLYGLGDNASSIARNILARDRDCGLVSRVA
jgi:putative flavoprotein involved in K+ transport